MSTLAVVILTKNEEKHIKACIESAKFADEILVIDSGSEDKTEELATKAGARFITHTMGTDGFAGQRNFALEQTKADWVFYLDADERITPAAAASIQAKVHANEHKYYTVQRYNVLFGQKMQGGGFGPDWSQRLYPRTAVHWEGVVHEHAICDFPEEQLDGYLEHYPYNDWHKYFEKFNHYTTLMAEKMYQSGKRATFMDIVLHPFFGFLRFYIFKKGFREGKLGYILACFHFAYTMAKYVKLYYLQTHDE